MELIIAEPFLVCVPMEILTPPPLQRNSYSPISDWWHRVYIEIWGPATCHACPAVSITFKDFTRFQIVLRNRYVKLAIQCAFIHSPINCIWYIDFFWSIFPVTIFYSLALMLFKEWECLASSFTMQCLFYPAFLLLASPSPCVLSHCPSHYYPVALRVYVLKFSRYIVIGNYLTHIFSRKCDQSQSILASTYSSLMLR